MQGIKDKHKNIDVEFFIRSVKRLKGCLKLTPENCDNPDCIWRDYCIKEWKGESK